MERLPLLKKADRVFELGKMAGGNREAQGYGIGKILLEHCLKIARRGMSKLILYSNTKLEPAIHLYRKYGFIEKPALEMGFYERANIKMELYL